MRPLAFAYLLALVLAASIAYDLLRLPVQVSDSLGEIIDAQASPSIVTTFVNSLGSKAYFRPLRLVQIKALFDASGGRYHLAYRGFHAALLLLTIGLFVRALRVTTAADLAAAAFALTVLTGLHTFTGTVAFAYPINHFLEIVMFALLALNLAQGPRSWLTDVAVALTFAAAAMTLESGLLVWVVAVAAWMVGMPGISRRGLAIVTVLLVAYFYVRFVHFPTGTPSLTERNSGFLLSMREPEYLQDRFGANPLPFYAYNVVCSLLSVLFAEPRQGVWVAVRDYLKSDLRPWTVVAIVSSSITTLLIAVAAWRVWRERDRMEGPDRLLPVFGLVLLANAALSYAYTKDEIVSVAGAFYALAAYAAVRRLISSPAISSAALRRLVLCVALLTASLGWAMRSEGLHYTMRVQAFKQRNEWAIPPPEPSDDPRTQQLIRRLRSDALRRTAVNPRFVPLWVTRWFEE